MRGASIRRGRRKRDPLERWYTPAEVAEYHVRWTQQHADVRSVADPCAGAGVYIDACRACGVRARGADVEPARPDVVHRDALDGDLLGGLTCITNPPFSLFPRLLPRLLAAYPVVSLLLPRSATEATRERGPIWRDRPPVQIHEYGRVHFGGPALTYGLEKEESPPKDGAAMAYVLALWLSSARSPVTVYSWRPHD